ncbi:MAG: GntR family transcriptional regulator [Microvirga sp.]
MWVLSEPGFEMYNEGRSAIGHALILETSGAATERAIFDRILNAVIEHRLKPGTKLTEESLVEIFGVTRGRVRKVLLLLSEHHVVQLQPNRGAFIASPTIEETEALFEARRVVERGIVEIVAMLSRERREIALDRLDEHLEAERDARRSCDHGRIIRLSGEFHTLLAELAGNSILTDILERLVRRTALGLATHADHNDTDCSPGDHTAIVEAIRHGDGERAASLALHHLDHIKGLMGRRHECPDPMHRALARRAG